jgi:hypothetical protein
LALTASGCETEPSAGATSAAASVPAPASAAAAPAAAPAAGRAELEAEVQAVLPALRRDCYEPYLRKGGERLAKPLQLLLEIGADGSVRDAAAAGGAAEQRALRGCIEDAARRFELSAPGEPTELGLVIPL